MRRSARRVAIAVASVVTVVAVSGVVLATLTPPPHPTAERAPGLPRVPQDLIWPLVDDCTPQFGAATYFSSITIGDGRLVVEYGHDDDGEYVPETGASELVNECLAKYRIDEAATASRPPTAAERALVYDWAVRMQYPCLRSRGIDVSLPSRSDFLDPDSYPWYLLQQQTGLLAFDVMLEARTSCPPVPDFLAGNGTGW